MAQDRKLRPRSGGAAAGFGKPRSPRPPRFGGEERAGKPPRFRSEGGTARPPSRFRSDDRPPRPARFRSEEGGAGGGDAGDPYKRAQRPSRGREEGGRGFTVTLDPDVARVFRGDASVNKALRLVMQLMHVVQGPSTSPRTGPPRASYGDRPQRPPREGYQGSAEARGFARKPRFEAGDEGDIEE